MFGSYKLTLCRVRDSLTVAEGGEKLKLTVDADALGIHTRIGKALDKLKALSNDIDNPEKAREAARTFAASIFGDKQAETLMAFYSDDTAAVIAICTQYLNGRLSKRIVAAQKRAIRR